MVYNRYMVQSRLKTINIWSVLTTMHKANDQGKKKDRYNGGNI